MNQKQFGILLVLVILLGGAGLLLRRTETRSWMAQSSPAGGRLLGNFPVNDVAQISILQETNTLNLVKKGDRWGVAERHDYPANFSRISELLLKVRDLKIVQSEQAGPSQLARLHLERPGQGTNSALAVEFKGQNGSVIKRLLLGKQHVKQSGRASPYGEGADWPDGRFVKTDDSEMVVVISDPLENIEPKPDEWLNKDFLHVEKTKTIAVTFPQATNSWKLERETETGDWKLIDAKPAERLDRAKTAEVSNPIGSLTFADVLPGGAIQQTGSPVVNVSTFDDFHYQIRVGPKTNDDYPVTVTVTAEFPKERTPIKDEKAEDKIRLDKEFKDRRQKLEDKLQQEQAYEKWIYLVASWALDPLLKERAQLLAESGPESKPAGKSLDDSGNPPGSNVIVPRPAGLEQ